LHGAPGVYSARYGGEPKNDEKNNDALLTALTNETNRDAHYYCAIVLVKAHNDPQPIIAEGVWRGKILTASRGTGGFGYDPLFLDVTLGKTGAELNGDEKNKVSHRGKALAELIKKLGNLT
jgi:XTP/dITP diphosphohydrolase